MCARSSKPPFASSGCRWRSARTMGRLSLRPARAGCRGSPSGGSSSAFGRPERIEPGKPQQNGRHERMHRTLNAETASPPAATLAEQQRRFDAFRAVYHDERPHEALDFETPACLHRVSERAYPCPLRELAYPPDAAVRRVRSSGEIKWGGDLIFVSEALVGEPVGIEETDGGECRWTSGPEPLEPS